MTSASGPVIPRVTLIALTQEASDALGSSALELAKVPFRVGRESRGPRWTLTGITTERRQSASAPNNELCIRETTEPLYAMLSWLLFLALAADDRPGLRALALTLVLTAALAGADEWRQSFVPGRSARLADVELDMMGGAAGLIGAWLFGTIRRRVAVRQRV